MDVSQETKAGDTIKRKIIVLLIVSLLALTCILIFNSKKETPSFTFEIMPNVSLNIYEDENHTYWPKLVEKKLFFDKVTSFSGIVHDNSDKYFNYSTLEISDEMTLFLGVVDPEEVKKVLFYFKENGMFVEKTMNDRHIFHIIIPTLSEHPVAVLKNEQKIFYPYNND